MQKVSVSKLGMMYKALRQPMLMLIALMRHCCQTHNMRVALLWRREHNVIVKAVLSSISALYVCFVLSTLVALLLIGYQTASVSLKQLANAPAPPPPFQAKAGGWGINDCYL